MDRYSILTSRIIREEVEKFILRENIGNIGSYSQTLKNLLTTLSQYDSSQDDKKVGEFLKKLDYYTVQIIMAINRCVKSNSLNERFSFSDFGINVPPELGGNLWNDMKDSYYNTKAFLNRFRGGSSSSSYSSAANNPNSVKTEKLSVLLSYLPQYQSEYNAINTAFGIEQKNQTPRSILVTIANLNADYQQAINAQGNP